MKTKTHFPRYRGAIYLFILASLCGLRLAAQTPAANAIPGAASGELVLTQAGKIIGREQFAIKPDAQGGWSWQARSSLNYPHSARLTFDSRHQPLSYQAILQPPGGVQIVQAKFFPGSVVLQVRHGETLAQARRAKPVTSPGGLPTGWWLLPANMFSLYGPLTRTYTAQKNNWQSVGAILPSFLAQIRRLSGSIPSAHGPLSLWQMQIHIGAARQRLTYVIDAQAKLVWLDLPQQHFQARRSDWSSAALARLRRQLLQLHPHALGAPAAATQAWLRQMLRGVRQIPVSIPTSAGALAGELTEPARMQSSVRLPAAVIVAGSGPTDGNGNSPLEPVHLYMYARLAAYLSRHGVAVLRYDKRGVGGSAKAKIPRHYFRFAQDAGAAVRYLAARPEVNPRRITLIGHSEGSALALWNADTDTSVASVISLEGAGRKFLRVLDWQLDRSVRRLPQAQKAAAEFSLRREEKILARIAAGLPVPASQIGNNLLLRAFYAYPRLGRGELDLNPIQYARRIHVPVLVIQGGRDANVTLARDARPLLAALPAGVPHKLMYFPNMTHMLYDVPAKGGFMPASPAQAKLDPSMKAAVLQWVLDAGK